MTYLFKLTLIWNHKNPCSAQDSDSDVASVIISFSTEVIVNFSQIVLFVDDLHIF